MTDVPSKPPQTTPPPKPKSRAPTTIFSSPPQLPDRSSLNISHTASTPTLTPTPLQQQQIHTDGNSQQPKSSPPPLPERQSFSNSPNRQTQSFIQKPALPPRDSQYNTISGSTVFKSNNNINNNNNDSHIITNGNASTSFIQGNRVTRVLNTNKSEPILQQPQQSHSPQQQQQQHTPNHQQPLSPQQQKDLAQKRSTMPLPPRPNKNRPLPTPISPESHPLTINEENSITEDKEQQPQQSAPPQPQLQQSQQNTDNSRKPIVAPPTPTIQQINKEAIAGTAVNTLTYTNLSNNLNTGQFNNSSQNETITIEQIPNTPLPTSNHPSLDHLVEFTTMRDLKCKEILTTERTYVDNMKILVEVFIKPLKEGEGGISKEIASQICGNIPDILLISIELLNMLESKLANWSNSQTIGDTFNKLTPFLKMYTNYTVGFDSVLTLVTDLEKNSTFSSFIQKCTEDPRTRKLDLRSYLIQPVQRITRYHMLLEEVLKHTDQSHTDYPPLTESYRLMKQVTSDANEAIKKSENRQKVYEIQKMFVTDPGIIAPHREFIYEGTLTKVCRKACKKRVVFLFSDILVYGSSIPPKLLLHEKIELDHCRIEDIPDGNLGGSSSISLNGNLINNAFQICSNKKSFVVFADSSDAKMQWMIVLIETIDKFKAKRKTIKKEKIDHAEAPVWVPDETADNCSRCKDEFSFVNRRHHCRNCGALVCGKCSDQKYKLPSADYKAVRVCNKCHETLTKSALSNLKV